MTLSPSFVSHSQAVWERAAGTDWVKSVVDVTSCTIHVQTNSIRIRSDDTIRQNTNTLFRALFSTKANTKRIFRTSLVNCYRWQAMHHHLQPEHVSRVENGALGLYTDISGAAKEVKKIKWNMSGVGGRQSGNGVVSRSLVNGTERWAVALSLTCSACNLKA